MSAVNFTHPGPAQQRLDRVIMAYFAEVGGCPELSRSQLKGWIEGGHVRVAGKVALKSGALVKAGQLIEVEPFSLPAQELTPYKYKLEIVHEDQQLLVINKPRALTMHPGAGNRDSTLANAVLHHCGQNIATVGGSGRAGIVHRLDKDTSGLVVIAKDIVSHRFLQRQFSERTVTRAYVALALSSPRSKRDLDIEDQGEIEGNIGRDPHNRLRMAVLKTGGKPARTSWQVMERFDYGLLLKLKLYTGRTHQIRVHLAHAGAPVIGDPVYGDFSILPKSLALAAHEFGSQALHAADLGFVHPHSGQRLEFSAAPPAEFAALIETWRNWRGRD